MCIRDSPPAARACFFFSRFGLTFPSRTDVSPTGCLLEPPVPPSCSLAVLVLTLSDGDIAASRSAAGSGSPLLMKENADIPYQLSLIHISEPTRLLSISYAVFCLKKKTNSSLNHLIITIN
eukprot:TRINITY_DN30603_c0_g1_i1.p1 TRINITY_DN30603_c0_g1~~TRINITY_DN30603_c0_g1_i1.p1  ORF type:complete len:121 (-),score=17.64 TRINITY_DN30603_c0_g1_i1:6-368(-)